MSEAFSPLDAPIIAPILVVDGQSANRVVMNRLLNTLKDIEVVEVHNCIDALEMMANRQFALMLLDMQMPGINGFEVAGFLQRHSQGDRSQTPIIFITAYNGNNIEHLISAYQNGAVDYITKPINNDILLSKVQTFTDLYRAKQYDAIHREFYKQTLDYMQEGVFRLSDNGKITYANAAAIAILKTKLPSPIGQALASRLPAVSAYIEDHRKLDCCVGEVSEQITGADRPIILSFCYGAVRHHGKRAGAILSFQDITERRHNEQRLFNLAQRDDMTGLYNRQFFELYVVQSFHRVRRRGDSLAILIVDLNGFKQVNDTLGHAAGDALLIDVAQRFKDTLRDTDVVARLGGNEFALSMEETTNNIAKAAMETAQKLAKSIDSIQDIRGKPVDISASIGIALYPEHGQNIENLTKSADMAMYKAKQNKTGIEFFTPEISQRMLRETYIDSHLKLCRQKQIIDIVYQPIILFDQDRPIALEALARWHDPKAKVTPPEFIHAAEKNGQIADLTEQVCQQVAMDMKAIDQNEKLAYVAINFSPVLFRNPAVFEQCMQGLQKHFQTDASQPSLCVEITESSRLQFDDYLQKCCQAFVANNWRIAIDDFGAEYSSIKYLEAIPCSIVKIDKTFICGITMTSKRYKLLAGITELAHDLNLTVIAEGIENKEEEEVILQAGCDGAQGYYYSRPINTEQLVRFIQSSSSRRR